MGSSRVVPMPGCSPRLNYFHQLTLQSHFPLILNFVAVRSLSLLPVKSQGAAGKVQHDMPCGHREVIRGVFVSSIFLLPTAPRIRYDSGHATPHSDQIAQTRRGMFSRFKDLQ